MRDATRTLVCAFTRDVKIAHHEDPPKLNKVDRTTLLLSNNSLVSKSPKMHPKFSRINLHFPDANAERLDANEPRDG